MKSNFVASLSAATILAVLSAGTANAGNVTITSVGFVGDTVTVAGSVANTLGWVNPFSTSENSGIIPLTTSLGQVIPVFCIDLFHTIGIGGGQSLPYTFGKITADSSSSPAGVGGNPLTSPVPEEIQSLVNIGAGAYLRGNGNADLFAGLQGAIWEIEYNQNGNSLTVTGSSSVDALISKYVTYAMNNPASYSISLYPGENGQAFGSGQGFGAAPEPSTWAMMLLGFAGLGFASYRTARAKSAPA